MWYVYLLESKTADGERYVGITSDLKRRLAEHNHGKSSHTSKFLPWQIVTYVAFSNQAKATSLSVISNPVPGTPSPANVCGECPFLVKKPRDSRKNAAIPIVCCKNTHHQNGCFVRF
ncbi:GIY-YIG nuclease family protein [Mesorhizobium sp. B261B1A]|uniref:GIY-YIG nuclease family protein n=1 Tax=unclassified Mesorhizobium TaxID=325217 RepID=UPI00398C7936